MGVGVADQVAVDVELQPAGRAFALLHVRLTGRLELEPELVLSRRDDGVGFDAEELAGQAESRSKRRLRRQTPCSPNSRPPMARESGAGRERPRVRAREVRCGRGRDTCGARRAGLASGRRCWFTPWPSGNARGSVVAAADFLVCVAMRRRWAFSWPTGCLYSRERLARLDPEVGAGPLTAAECYPSLRIRSVSGRTPSAVIASAAASVCMNS